MLVYSIPPSLPLDVTEMFLDLYNIGPTYSAHTGVIKSPSIRLTDIHHNRGLDAQINPE